MKALRLECYCPYNDKYEYIICENEEYIKNNIHSKLNVSTYKEISLADIYNKEGKNDK